MHWRYLLFLLQSPLAESISVGVPVILEETKGEEWTSPQGGYVDGPKPSLILRLVLQRARCTWNTGHQT